MALYEINPNNMRGSGDFFLARAGEALGRCALVYKHANGAWYLADADAAATMPTLGITMDRATVAGQIVRILDKGFIGRTTWTWTTGGEIYASTVAGGLTQTAPAGLGDVVQVVAMATSPHMIKFSSDIGSGSFPDLSQFFPTVDPDSNKGTYAAAKMTDGFEITVRQTFVIPKDVAVITTAAIVLIPEGTGNLRRSATTNFGALCNNEQFDTHTDSIAEGVVAVTDDEIECIDITGALTGATAGDIVGISFIRHADDVLDTVNADVYYLGIYIEGT